MPDPARFADLWAMLCQGGLSIETWTADQLAMRTILQLDGDRLTIVYQRNIRNLPMQEKRDLASRHTAAVRTRSLSINSDGRRIGKFLGHAVVATAIGVELYEILPQLALCSLLPGGLGDLAAEQIVPAILLGGRAALPWLISKAVPLAMRWQHALASQALSNDWREETNKYHQDSRH